MSVKVLVGCYTTPESKQGLHLLDIDEENGGLTLIKSHVVKNSSFAIFTAPNSIIYTVNENHSNSDSLTAVSFNKENSTFLTLSQVEINGSDPCYITVDSKQRHLFTANYSDGTLSCVSLKDDGSLGELVQVIKHEVDSMGKFHVNSHMHAVVLSPCENFLLASNLGQDTLTVYNYQPNELKPLSETGIGYQFPVGTGPRHLIFDQNAKFIYVVGELDASLHVLAWDNGKLTLIQKLMLMPMDFEGKNSAADLHFGANGFYLYVSNRGEANQIISFAINKETGEATLLERVPSLGQGPRNFAIDPTGRLMLVAHQYTNDMRLFTIDPLNGKLYNTGQCLQLNSPVFICFLQ